MPFNVVKYPEALFKSTIKQNLAPSCINRYEDRWPKSAVNECSDAFKEKEKLKGSEIKELNSRH